MVTLNLIGAGRVGKTLANLLVANGVLKIGDVYDTDGVRAEEAVEFIGAGCAVTDVAKLKPADIWLLSVPDTEIERIARQLVQHCEKAPGSIAIHCSGALASDILAPLRMEGWKVASAHPVLSFADPRTAVFQFEGTPCALEGDDYARTTWGKAMTSIGAQCFDIHSDRKKLYHAAAVFASNFLPVLATISLELWEEAGIPDDLRKEMLPTLIKNSVDNIIALGPKDALTGPAARGDEKVVRQQAKALSEWDPRTSEAYEALSALATRLASTGVVKLQENH